MVDAFPDASYEEQLKYPTVLKSFHQYMEGAGGRSKGTAKSYMRSFASLLSEHAKSVKACATVEYHTFVKAMPRNKSGNNALSAAVKGFIEYWENRGEKLHDGEGEYEPVVEADLKMYTVKDTPRGTPSGGAPAPAKDAGEAEKKPAKEAGEAEKKPAKEAGEAEKKLAKEAGEAEKKSDGRKKREKSAAESLAANGVVATTTSAREGPASATTSSEPTNGRDSNYDLVEEYDGFVVKRHGSKWTVLPDDVLVIDLAAIISKAEASGWKCTSKESARCTLSGEAEMVLHVAAGQMDMQAASKDIVLGAAQRLVDEWLVEAD